MMPSADTLPSRKQEVLSVVADDALPEQQSHSFQADVSRLLHLMVHSVYSERDVFLRELISNASDACEKLRYEALGDPALIDSDSTFRVSLTVDNNAGTLTVADNGIGMDHDELISALGTIANSGTRAFLEKLGSAPGDVSEKEEDGGKASATAELIGQFGIGFYASFMVADKVDVQSRRAGAQDAWTWSSDGNGVYTIQALPLEAAPRRGTRVILHLNDKSKEFLQAWRLESIVREHSAAISIPIELQETPSGEARELSDGAALWTKARSAITEQNYKDFYQSLAGQFEEPALTLHWRVEGRHEYTVLAFIPGSRPLDLFDPERKGRGKLYVRRVLISQNLELLPGWLRFVRLVVDSPDLPLNVSREMIQESPIFAAIKRGVTNRIIQELTKLAEANAERFSTIWDNFGAVLKEGLYEDAERRDQIFKIARFVGSLHASEKKTLAEYVAALRPNQTAIYYLTGDDVKRMAASPHIEGFSARGVDVLLLSDPVDSFWVSTAAGFEGKPFKSVSQGTADIKLIPLLEERDECPADTVGADVATLIAYMKQILSDVVSEVRPSDRLSGSPACLVASESGPDRRLEQILAQHGRLSTTSKPVLEINPSHALIVSLAHLFKRKEDAEHVGDIIWLLFDEARIMDGESPLEAAAFAVRLTRVMARASS